MKASYAFSSKVSAMVEVVNGWDLLRDNNHSKSLGTQLTLTPVAPLSVVLNWIGGAELANDNHSQRNVFEVVATLKPERMNALPDGSYVFDMGQNMVGWVALRVSGKAGTTVRLRFAEILNPDGTPKITKAPRPAIACATPVSPGMEIYTNTPR